MCLVKCITEIENKTKFCDSIQDSATETFNELTDEMKFVLKKFLNATRLCGWPMD